MYNTTGRMNTRYEIWKRAPRSIYFEPETSSPAPRVYLSKRNHRDYVEVTAAITNIIDTTFTLSGTYNVNVDVFIFGSNINY